MQPQKQKGEERIHNNYYEEEEGGGGGGGNADQFTNNIYCMCITNKGLKTRGDASSAKIS